MAKEIAIPSVRLDPDLVAQLCCPACRGSLSREVGPAQGSADPDQRFAGLACVECGRRYPIVDGVPILIAEEKSLFDLADYTQDRETYFKKPRHPLLRALRRVVPEISVNVKAKRNFAHFERQVIDRATKPVVLVLGGSIVGSGMEEVVASPRLRVVETDIALSDRVHLICDGHDIPFAEGTFDGVIVQAVLEHVLDPYRCVDEIHRVLKPGGVVYAETAFMQGVHGGRYDFMRFTWLGHRRLFRRFAEIESGSSCGPGMALGWAHRYFWRAVAGRGPARALARIFVHFTAFFWKWFDYMLVDRPVAWDGASAVYFLGTRSETMLSDRELLKLYRTGVD